MTVCKFVQLGISLSSYIFDSGLSRIPPVRPTASALEKAKGGLRLASRVSGMLDICGIKKPGLMQQHGRTDDLEEGINKS